METEHQMPADKPEQQENSRQPGQEHASATSGDQLVEELGRLGRKFIEVVEVAWTSDQRHQIEQDLRAGFNTVVHSLEAGLQDIGEKEQTKEFVEKAEDLADSVGETVRTSEFANELARSLAKGLRAMGDQLDRLAREIHSTQSATEDQVTPSPAESQEGGQEIPITQEPSSPDA